MSARRTSEVQNPKLLCTRRTRLKKIGQQVMVGDRVVVEEPDWAGGRGAIAEVLPRNTQLDRPPVANADQILLVFAVTDPPLDPYQMTRFLVKAESTGLDICLCLNKSDLVSDEELEEWRSRFKEWGYNPIFISVHKLQGLEELKHQLSQRITVVAGPSGVGKSSLINTLIPNVNLRVGEVSGKLSRGRHTTRHVELFELPTGGLLADTPGFNQPDIECSPEELTLYFPEARERLAVANCQFSDCLHRDEPNCAVRDDWERYEYYLDLLDEAIAYQDWLNQQADPESVLKAKARGKGQTQYEPKLETKKYRRISRRSQQQKLQELYQDAEAEAEEEED
ncbi:MAG: small ribosomal subunit biogenesis GTPase RsgA [Coleofasciculus sp. S288]|nr:small ribosomal subunit biogenesis GTPase RsgA [Coleofasciculus sp. S288]